MPSNPPNQIISEREMGALEQEVKEIRHDFRNLKTVVTASGIASITIQDVNFIRAGISKLEQRVHNLANQIKDISALENELVKLKIKVYTAFSVIAILSGAVGWLLEVASRLGA